MIPKGKLLIIGGAEYSTKEPPALIEKTHEFPRYEILSELLPNLDDSKIEIITTGSSVPNEVKTAYQKVFRRLGVHKLGFIPIQNRLEAHEAHYITRVKEAGVIFFSGGDQFRLSTILGGTPIIDTIKDRYQKENDFIVAGTSAGAMVMSSTMIASGGLTEALIYRDLITSAGFGLLGCCIIDTHFIKRGRFGRLAHAIIMNPGKVGIGLGENTALIIKNGSDAQCRGTGMVVIIDGREVGQTNISTVNPGEAVFVENLIVHLLVQGCHFSLDDRKLCNPAILIK